MHARGGQSGQVVPDVDGAASWREQGAGAHRARESALRAENRRLRELHEQAPVGLLALDEQGLVVAANKTGLRLLGAKEHELVGTSLRTRIALEDRLELIRHLHQAVKSPVACSCQLRFEDGPGVLRFVGRLDSVACFDESGRPLCRTALCDATSVWREQSERIARLRAEQVHREEAEARERRFGEIALQSAELSESLDLAATLRRAARIAVPLLAAYCAIDLGDPDGQVRRAAFARAGHETDLPLDPYAPRGSANVARSGVSVVMAPVVLGDVLGLAARPEDLTELSRSVRSYVCVPLRAHGRALGAMTFARAGGPGFSPPEITLAEDIARHTSLAIDNARLYRDAQEADRRKDEFLAMLSHELRNPLAAIAFATAILRRRASSDPDLKRTTDIIERQSARLVRLVDELVEVSRITRGKIVLQRRRVALRDIVVNAIESMRPLVEAKGHTVSLEAPPEDLVLDADAARLEQVLVNLITNAAKYTDAGGHIDVSVERRGAEGIVRVRDDGIGVAKEMLATMFEPFAQVDPTLARTDRGIGIGLALAKALVELHGGSIVAHSEGHGRGTELVVRLPILEDAKRPPEEPDAGSDEPPVSRRRRVLVVDDQPDLAALLTEELSLMGHDVRVAHDGLTALGAAMEFGPELMFIDIGLPGLSGYEVAKQLRKEPRTAQTTLVALTGYGGSDTVERCRGAGFDRHFTKPISEESLREVLDA